MTRFQPLLPVVEQIMAPPDTRFAPKILRNRFVCSPSLLFLSAVLFLFLPLLLTTWFTTNPVLGDFQNWNWNRKPFSFFSQEP
jgi:hypothetical protein